MLGIAAKTIAQAKERLKPDTIDTKKQECCNYCNITQLITLGGQERRRNSN
jgi:hypothetical protein